MLSVSSRVWTRVAVSISYDDNDYTTGTSIKRLHHGQGRDYMHTMYLYFCCIFWVIFFNGVDSTLLRKWAVLQSAIFFAFHIGWDCQVSCKFFLSVPFLIILRDLLVFGTVAISRWRLTYYIYKDHSINKGHFFFKFRRDLLYIRESFNK